MINLEKYSGLPIQMREDYSLVFENPLPPMSPEIRDFSAMRNYLKNPSSTYHRRDVYHIYRDLALPQDVDAIHEAGLEYDLTVIPPGKINNEFVKTLGHYHPCKSGTKIRYPEIYEVIHGRLFLLIQSASEDFERLSEVYLIEAERGEKIVIPPGFGHVSINPADDVLVLSNIQPLGNKGIYEPYEKHNGAAFYVLHGQRLTAKGETAPEYEFVPNLNYNLVPKLQHARPRELPQYDLRSALPLYFTSTKNLKALDFITSPENYLNKLVPDKLYAKT